MTAEERGGDIKKRRKESGENFEDTEMVKEGLLKEREKPEMNKKKKMC